MSRLSRLTAPKLFALALIPPILIFFLVSLHGTLSPSAPSPVREFSVAPGPALLGEDGFTSVENRSEVVTDKVDQGCDLPSSLSPQRVYIPALCVSAPLVPSPVSGGELQLPRDLSQVGLSTEGASLDAKEGTTLLSGHVKWNTDLGVLHDISLLYPGARVITVDGAGSEQVWIVHRLESYRKEALPKDIFQSSGVRRLALVTCGGRLLRNSSGSTYYEDNVVAVAVPMESLEDRQPRPGEPK